MNSLPSTTYPPSGAPYGPPQFTSQSSQYQAPQYPTSQYPPNIYGAGAGAPPTYTQEPSSQQMYSALPSTSIARQSPTKDFFINQKVRVCIRGQVWVMGLIVCVLDICQKVTGMRLYEVEYIEPDTKRQIRDCFPEDRIGMAPSGQGQRF